MILEGKFKYVHKFAEKSLKQGGVGVIPTDTIYGVVGSALNKKAVERIYRLRRRNPKKPMIILIGSLAQLKLFGIIPSVRTLQHLQRLWPGKISIILPLDPKRYTLNAKLRYLHRGTNTLAFRFPKPYWLKRLVAKVGPLVAPSANPEGKKPAITIKEAKKYFNNRVDFYINGGVLRSKPSRLVKITDGKLEILRK
ncbi:MAG: L-threonylcarbamoyladenylate synthase [Patescibacteria group bacterium]